MNDDILNSEEQIQKRIVEIEKQMALLTPIKDGLKWLELNDSVKILKKRLESLQTPTQNIPIQHESVQEQLYREAKERYEKRREEAGDNWWEMFD